MKTIFKIPVLLLALMLVVSCGDSKKEEEGASTDFKMAVDAETYCQLQCNVYSSDGVEREKAKEIFQDATDKIEAKYRSDKAKNEKKAKAAQKVFKREMENCDCKD